MRNEVHDDIIEIRFSVDGNAEPPHVVAVFLRDTVTPESSAAIRADVERLFCGRTVRMYVSQPSWRRLEN